MAIKIEYSIRQAAPADANQICRVWIRSIRELCGPLYQNDERVLSVWCANKTIDQVTIMIQDPENHFVVATDGADQILGLGILSASEIRACYVSPEALGKGIGRAILLVLEEEARRQGNSRLELGSTRHAFVFYERNGYKRTSEKELLFRDVIPYIPMEKVL